MDGSLSLALRTLTFESAPSLRSSSPQSTEFPRVLTPKVEESEPSKASDPTCCCNPTVPQLQRQLYINCCGCSGNSSVCRRSFHPSTMAAASSSSSSSSSVQPKPMGLVSVTLVVLLVCQLLVEPALARPLVEKKLTEEKAAAATVKQQPTAEVGS